MSISPNNKGKRQWMHYAGMGGQFLGAILLAVLAGRWLDDKTHTSVPWFSLTLPLLAVVGMLVQLIKSTRPPDNKKP